MRKWDNKYRIPTTRAAWWDYAKGGVYFITICTHNRIPHFGNYVNGQMRLTTAGAIAQGFWYEIPQHFPFVTLGNFIIMPNHLHGILIINFPDDFNNDRLSQPFEDIH